MKKKKKEKSSILCTYPNVGIYDINEYRPGETWNFAPFINGREERYYYRMKHRMSTYMFIYIYSLLFPFQVPTKYNPRSKEESLKTIG